MSAVEMVSSCHAPGRAQAQPDRLAGTLVVLLAAILMGLVPGSFARAEKRGVTPEEQEKINKSVERGVAALKALQDPEGTWAKRGPHQLGYAAFPGLTLLECDVPARDPAILLAARAVRLLAPKVDDTYDISLAILFLDRLGEARDKELIQTLAARLLAGQTITGGWGYKCPMPNKQEKKDIIQALAKLDPPQGEELEPGKKPPRVQDVVPANLRNLPIFREGKQPLVDPANKDHQPLGATTDNSNSQFAMLALWAAGRHQIPIKRSRDLIAQRYRTSQNSDGGWGYRYRFGGGEGAAGFGGGESPTTTCAGLLGLAIGLGQTAKPTGKEKVDPAVLKGFVSLGKHVGNPPGGRARKNLYLMWSIERVAVLYDLPTISGKDWYRWASEMLLQDQQPNGHWNGGGYWGATAASDTSFALLVLKRANLAADLGAQLPFQSGQVEQAVNTESTRMVEIKPPDRPITPNPAPATNPNLPVIDPVNNPVEPVTSTPIKEQVETPEPSRGRAFLWVLLAISVLILFAGVGALVLYLASRSRADEPDDWQDRGSTNRRRARRS